MRILMFFLLSLVAAPAVADREDVFSGVWNGTLGDHEIIACFNGNNSYGSYYYLSHRKPIRLEKMEGAGVWQETLNNSKTGAWELKAIANKGEPVRLTGIWKNPKGGASLPISLAASIDEGGAPVCGSDAYNLPLERNPSIVAGKTLHAGTHSYQLLDYPNQQSIHLDAPGANYDAINSALLKRIDRSSEMLREFYSSRREALSSYGADGQDELSTEIQYWSTDFVSFRFYRWAYGTGRVGIGWDIRTWDILAGEEVDPWDWFVGHSAAKHQGTLDGWSPLPSKLRQILLPKIKRQLNDGCDEYLKADRLYALEIKNGKFQIYQDAVGDGCDVTLNLDLRNLDSVLSASGKAAVARLLSDRDRYVQKSPFQ